MTQFATFGPSLGLTEVDAAVLDTLKTWLPTYLAQQELYREKPNRWLKRPRASSYVNALDEIESLPDAVLPAIVAITPSSAGDPMRDGNGFYSAPYRLVVYAFVRGSNAIDTRFQADMFATSIIQVITQKAVDHEVISDVSWDGIAIDPVDDDSSQSRSLAVGVAAFTVVVENVVNDTLGPSYPDPPDDPDDPDNYVDYPEVTAVNIDVTAIPIDSGGS